MLEEQAVELEEDLDRVKKDIDNQARKKNAFDRHCTDTIKKLKEEKAGLATHLQQAGEREKLLSIRKNSINTRILLKRASMQEHCTNMEGLNTKICDILFVKGALEKQLEDLTKHNDTMTSSVRYSLDRARQLEQNKKNQEKQQRNLEKDCEKFKSESQYLLGRLEKVKRSEEIDIQKPTNLLLEIEQADQHYYDESKCLDNQVIRKLYEDKELERNDDVYELDTEIDDLKDEVFLVYQQSKSIIFNLRRGKCNNLPQSSEIYSASSGSRENVQSEKVPIYRI